MEAQLQQGDEDWTPADEGAPAETAKRFGRQAHDLAQSNALLWKREGAFSFKGYVLWKRMPLLSHGCQARLLMNGCCSTGTLMTTSGVPTAGMY